MLDRANDTTGHGHPRWPRIKWWLGLVPVLFFALLLSAFFPKSMETDCWRRTSGSQAIVTNVETTRSSSDYEVKSPRGITCTYDLENPDYPGQKLVIEEPREPTIWLSFALGVVYPMVYVVAWRRAVKRGTAWIQVWWLLVAGLVAVVLLPYVGALDAHSAQVYYIDSGSVEDQAGHAGKDELHTA